VNQIQRKPPGFFEGFSVVFGAFRFLAREPGTWPLAVVPAMIFVVIGAVGVTLGVTWVTPALLSSLGLADPQSWLSTVGQWLVAALSTLLSAVVGFFVAFAVTPPLSAPALEHLVGMQESALGIEKRAPMSLFAEIWCGVKAQAIALAAATPILVLLWLIDVLFPAAVVATTPLSIFVVSLALAWNLFDYPLTLRGVAVGDRIGFILAHGKAVLGFGLAFSALFWVPCFGVLMLPVGAVAATRLIWRMVEASPGELPALPRPRPEFSPTAQLPQPEPEPAEFLGSHPSSTTGHEPPAR
jgi:CysZ protein